jgi:hypothetical protein
MTDGINQMPTSSSAPDSTTSCLRAVARGTRPRKYRIDVWCNDDELATIKANARQTRLSQSEFLRSLGQGHNPKNVFDRNAIRELSQLYADQGHLGGLMKQVLSDKRCDSVSAKIAHSILQQIEDLEPTIARLIVKEARHL